MGSSCHGDRPNPLPLTRVGFLPLTASGPLPLARSGLGWGSSGAIAPTLSPFQE
ncbi:hypothetical protein NG799_14240 [Laspinema sp. D1]|uniref:Uncharacterized protein n=1 Tax=Laspinema palackyanum D2a TaxID=2953684 RepID=A0ABT2MRW3_9CYAN|nr:hypothetical protein [Laspinema sp. D2a]